MNRRLVTTLCVLFFLLPGIFSRVPGQEPPKTLTIWLIPLELASEDKTMDFDAFNREVGAGGLVTVLNTTVSYYPAS